MQTDRDLTRRSYRTYFKSGAYDRRYPGPNLSTLSKALSLLPADGHLIDYGCGSGRYLAHFQGRCRIAAGYDVSDTALDLVRQHAADAGWSELVILGPAQADLCDHVKECGRADLILCLFGVLGHIANPDERHRVLVSIQRKLLPGSGRLLVSVPNRRRRFLREQRESKGDLVHYQRQVADGQVTLPYQLYDQKRLRSELAGAGFTDIQISAESILPESWLTRLSICRAIDSLLLRFCPVSMGYGLIAEAMA